MSTSDRSQPKAASERAYEWVKNQILDGHLEGGQLLSEGEVATALELSRTPVREAFLRLEVEGLLRLYPKRGALVVPVSASEVAEVTEARILLESHAAATVIARGDQAAVVRRMRATLGEQRALDVPAETDAFSRLDRRFHATLVEAAGNGLITQFYSGLHDRQVRMATSALHRAPSRYSAILTEHDTLCELLLAGDAEGFRARLGVHIGGTHGALLDS
ncbi:GntR family transcriptional regulator [Prauserella cavernicola]|uniref:GntR family transcriptional regulator n=1 Tax=Prauserella cavernicola TaxID=2800127 RepID=A0A934R0V2_9PSEU|nr:GntR family transcriptional regulator [Prauserella cavernicola]MBK1788834.1 GntR family transcriptional regulator [Prauserella cavernicola]